MDKPDREAAFEALKELRSDYGYLAEKLAAANEAETRLLLVDRVLQILGWDPKEFKPEQPVVGVGYLDYLLMTDGIPRVVVEAKRVGNTFGLAQSRLKRAAYALKYMRTAFGSALGDVLRQAQGYAMEKMGTDQPVGQFWAKRS